MAGFGTTFAALADLVGTLRRQILWIYYGLLIVSRPVVIWNVVAILIHFLSVGAYFYFSGRERAKQ